ncbi:MAG: hypothetical protein KAI83_08890 [Thiomargarita sp.]|nr:hypothetical protein [Thiomargarita sp.]
MESNASALSVWSPTLPLWAFGVQTFRFGNGVQRFRFGRGEITNAKAKAFEAKVFLQKTLASNGLHHIR